MLTTTAADNIFIFFIYLFNFFFFFVFSETFHVTHLPSSLKNSKKVIKIRMSSAVIFLALQGLKYMNTKYMEPM